MIVRESSHPGSPCPCGRSRRRRGHRGNTMGSFPAALHPCARKTIRIGSWLGIQGAASLKLPFPIWSVIDGLLYHRAQPLVLGSNQWATLFQERQQPLVLGAQFGNIPLISRITILRALHILVCFQPLDFGLRSGQTLNQSAVIIFVFDGLGSSRARRAQLTI